MGEDGDAVGLDNDVWREFRTLLYRNAVVVSRGWSEGCLTTQAVIKQQFFSILH